MAGTIGVSSKRKSSSSSSSIKKKRAHDLSQVRKRKRSRSRVKKSKPKKLRRRDESISDSDSDDDSRSFSSSSDDNRGRKRSRSRTRSDVKKKSEKRSRKDSSNSESERNVKKRKKSKKNVKLDTKKKSKRKKSKRVVTVSSSSSDSRTCSTCRGDSSNSGGEDRGRYSKEDDYQGGNTSRRLRSIITVMKRPEENEEREFDRDGYKEEEIIYDQDEYPSCRSNDSDDAKMKVDEKLKTEEEEETGVMGIDGDDRYEASYPSSDEYGAKKQFIEIKNEDLVDTELILRQRALENLRKFRGERQKKVAADPKEQNDDHVKQSSIVSPTNVSDENHAPNAMKLGDRFSKNKISPGTHEFVPLKEDGRTGTPEFVPLKEDGRTGTPKFVPLKEDGRTGTPEFVPLKEDGRRLVISSMQDDRKLQDDKDMGEDTIKNRSKPSTSILGREPFHSSSSLKQVSTPMASPKVVKPVVHKSDVHITDTETSNIEPGTSITDPSCLKTETGEQSSNNMQGETKDVSQYEQKTMSVMRGGEMVQVSYKVYIPKKTPALARRKLRR